jgi:ribulose-5-phosphate 4-epimerase/fuculose-1-phosphate aldolase
VKKNASLARKVALSCRILAKLGLFKETTGHVSARNSRDQNADPGPRAQRDRAPFYQARRRSLGRFGGARGKAWKERPASNLPTKLVFTVKFMRPAPTLLAWCMLTRPQ